MRNKILLIITSILIFALIGFASAGNVNTTLSYPTNGINGYVSSPTTFNGTANTSAFTSIKNVTLWTNITGSWVANQSLSYSPATFNKKNTGTFDTGSATYDDLNNLSVTVNDFVRNVTAQIKGGPGFDVVQKFKIVYTDASSVESGDTTSSTGAYVESSYVNPNPSKNVSQVVSIIRSSAGGSVVYTKDINATIYRNNTVPVNFSLPLLYNQLPLLWNIQTCDEDSNCTFSNANRTLNYRIFGNSQTYNSITTEAAVESFQINLTLAGTLRVTTGNLIYNGTSYPASVTLSGNTYLLRSLTIPDVSSTINRTFYWSINTDDGNQTNTTETIQTVQNLGIDNCGVYTNKLFNITLYDEDNQSLLNGATQNTSVKLTFQVSSTTGTNYLNYSNNFTYTNPVTICSQNSFGNSTFRLDGLIEYSSLGRFTEFYNFQNYSLSNSTTNVNISLYNLNSSRGQEFKITYKDSNFVPVSGAILQIQRRYIEEGVYKTTEIPKTGTEGYTVGHLVPNDVIYNIIVLKDGSVLATFNEIVADCQNPLLETCYINLNSFGSNLMPDDFSTSDDITFTLTFNKTTREVNSIFSIISGATSTVTLNVTLFDTLGNTSVCSDSLYSSGGELSCIVPTGFGNSTIIAKLYKDGVVVGTGIISMAQKPSELYGTSLIFVALIVLLIMIGIGATSDSPMIMAIMMGLGLVVLIALNLIYTPSIFGIGATVLWFMIAIVIVLIKGAGRQ